MMQYLPLLAAAVVAWVFLRGARDYRAAARRRNRLRASYFTALTPRLTRTEPSGFPRVALDLQGRPFDLQAIPDSLSFRKLPCLWLLVTLTAPQPFRAETRIMARASGLEPFSTFATLPCELPLPAGFPDHCTLRTTDPAALPDLAPYAGLFNDPKVKELTLSPKGLRLVVLAEEAPRTAYLLYREAELPSAPLDPARAQALMQALIALEAEAALPPPTAPSPERRA